MKALKAVDTEDLKNEHLLAKQAEEEKKDKRGREKDPKLENLLKDSVISLANLSDLEEDPQRA